MFGVPQRQRLFKYLDNAERGKHCLEVETLLNWWVPPSSGCVHLLHMPTLSLVQVQNFDTIYAPTWNRNFQYSRHFYQERIPTNSVQAIPTGFLRSHPLMFPPTSRSLNPFKISFPILRCLLLNPTLHFLC